MARLTNNAPPLPLWQQDRLLRRDWPFRTVLLGDDLALWRGRVYGLSQGYEVSILYVRRHFQQGFESNGGRCVTQMITRLDQVCGESLAQEVKRS